jgi:hypothetical protein
VCFKRSFSATRTALPVFVQECAMTTILPRAVAMYDARSIKSVEVTHFKSSQFPVKPRRNILGLHEATSADSVSSYRFDLPPSLSHYFSFLHCRSLPIPFRPSSSTWYLGVPNQSLLLHGKGILSQGMSEPLPFPQVYL